MKNAKSITFPHVSAVTHEIIILLNIYLHYFIFRYLHTRSIQIGERTHF